MEQFRGQNRLPDFAVPRRYDIRLRPDLVACTFSGAVDVLLEIRRETRFLVVNALDLAVDSSSIVFAAHEQYRPAEVAVLKEDELVVLAFDEPIPAGEGVLSIAFSGVLNDLMKGFYRSSYVVNGEKKNMAVTQFEAVDARRCFPCWDEPALKARFKITLDVPSNVTALSNMPIVDEKADGDVKTVSYEESPLMSTYLVAFVVGLFDVVHNVTNDGVKVSVYCPVGKSELGKFALDVAVKALDHYKNYFATPYPLPKLDMVAIPDFAAGAMENYGLITYRDTALLYDEKQSSASGKQWIAIVIAHELAHQWFGNLVTMEWWTHLWLNEGFATWVSFLAVDFIFPEWKIWTQFLGDTNGGLKLDALGESHPIEVEVGVARSVDEIFDAISYQKGASIIRMLQNFLGADIFQKSLASYVKKFAFKNAKTEDLWGVLSEVSGMEVNKLMDTWTKQKGYPVVSIKLNDNVLEFKQSQFCSNGSVGNGQWIIPLTIYFGLDQKCRNYLLESKLGSMNMSEIYSIHDGKNVNELKSENWWVKANFEQAGFYRVKYDEKLAERLQTAIKAHSLSTADRFGILNDSYALCEACEQPLSSLLSLMRAYGEELDYVVASELIKICKRVMKIVGAALPDCLDDFKAFAIRLLLHAANKLGWDHVSGESHLNVLLRGDLLTALVVLGHDATLIEASTRFQNFLDDKNTSLLPADTREAAYLSVMKAVNRGNRSGFESLLKLYRETDNAEEKCRLLSSLAFSPDPEIVLEALNFAKSSEVRGQDIGFVLSGISSEGHDIAWTWLKENWDEIVEKWSASFLLPSLVRGTISRLYLEENAQEVEAFFATRVTPSIAMTLKQSVEQVRINARWLENIKQERSLEALIKDFAAIKD